MLSWKLAVRPGSEFVECRARTAPCPRGQDCGAKARKTWDGHVAHAVHSGPAVELGMVLDDMKIAKAFAALESIREYLPERRDDVPLRPRKPDR